MNETAEPVEIDGVSLIGFRINPDSDTPDFYTLLTYGVVDTALTLNNDLVFFIKFEQKQQAFELFSEDIKRKFVVPDKLELVADVATALYLIENESSDNSAIILNCLNTLFDLLYSVGKQISDERKNVLFQFADHLTFEHEFEQYLTSNSISRESVIDALLWCVGAIVTRSKILFN